MVRQVAVSRASASQSRHLPGVRDVIRDFGKRGFLDIRLKVRGLESIVLEALRQHPPERGYVISSLFPDVVLELKARSEVAQVGIVCGKPHHLMRWRTLPADFVIAHHALVTKKLVQSVHSTGRKLFAWTVNDVRTTLRLAGWGVDAVISDTPQALLKGFEHPESLLAMEYR